MFVYYINIKTTGYRLYQIISSKSLNLDGYFQIASDRYGYKKLHDLIFYNDGKPMLDPTFSFERDNYNFK